MGTTPARARLGVFTLLLGAASALPAALSLGIVPILPVFPGLGPYRAPDFETGVAIAEQGNRALLDIHSEARLLRLTLPVLILAKPEADK